MKIIVNATIKVEVKELEINCESETEVKESIEQGVIDTFYAEYPDAVIYTDAYIER